MPPLSFFSLSENDRLASARRQVRAGSATVVYCVYENPFAMSGGIAAVAENYCAELVAQHRSVLAVTPLHGRLKTAPALDDLQYVGHCDVPFDSRRVQVELYEFRQAEVRWVLMGSDEFFQADGGGGGSDPYVYSSGAALLDDSLFASAAVPFALAALGLKDNLLVHLNDWETAATALTVKQAILAGIFKSAAVVLTSHNPYDCDVTLPDLRKITHRRPPDGATTMYQCMVPITDAPVVTVSRTFAIELTRDSIQVDHYARHLQSTLQHQGVVGIDNGLFGRLRSPFSNDAINFARRGNPERILAEKRGLRKTMLEVLAEYDDPRRFGRLLGDDQQPLTTLADDVPVFMMFGRLDPGQKGFDILSRAIERLPEGAARFVLAPIVGDVPAAFVDDLKNLAEKSRPGEVVVYPFRMQRGYMETMAGTTFAIMPSLYEPFGAATEPYLCGTPVIARATGGLLQQVNSLDDRAGRPTGILFHERLVDASPLISRLPGDALSADPAIRLRQPIYRAMVTALEQAINTACEIYRAQPSAYAHLLANIPDKLAEFSWKRNVAEYHSLYELATR